MSRIPWEERISVKPDLHHGEPCIRGTRTPIRIILGSLADNMTPDEIIQEYPQLSREDIHAALSYAAEAVRSEIIAPIPPKNS